MSDETTTHEFKPTSRRAPEDYCVQLYGSTECGRPRDAEVHRPAIDDVRQYINDYELRGDGGDYLPNANERLLIEDCLRGYISDNATPAPQIDDAELALQIARALDRYIDHERVRALQDRRLDRDPCKRGREASQSTQEFIRVRIVQALQASGVIARLVEADVELKVTDALLSERQKVLDAIPPCEAHGSCVPHAIEWIEEAKPLRASLAAQTAEIEKLKAGDAK